VLLLFARLSEWTNGNVEFDIGFARMQGKRALFPQGYHCSGMPIKAAADKLVREMEMFGSQFERYVETTEVPDDVKTPAAKTDMGKFSGSKSKAVAKTGGAKYQFQVRSTLAVLDLPMFPIADYLARSWPALEFHFPRFPSLPMLHIGLNTFQNCAKKVRESTLP
jgi:hypothetical protein